MIHSGTLPIKCQVAAKDSSNTSNRESHLQQTNSKIDNSPTKKQSKIVQNLSKSEPVKSDRNRSSNPLNSQIANSEISPNNAESQLEKSNPVSLLVNVVNEHPDDIIGGVAGVAGGVATVAAAGATAALSVPVAGAVLIGLGIWFAIRTVF